MDTAKIAIKHSLSGNWEQAIKYNSQILDTDPDNVDALNRLARAYLETGHKNKAIKTTKKVLKLDPLNKIATRALLKYTSIKSNSAQNYSGIKAVSFIEEHGKTKMLTLINTAGGLVIDTLEPGVEVKLNTHSNKVSVLTLEGKYVGRLPDDIGTKLKRLTTKGNEYDVHVKSVHNGTVKIFIREIHRAKELENVPSFTGEKIDYVSFTPPELVHKGDLPRIERDDDDE